MNAVTERFSSLFARLDRLKPWYDRWKIAAGIVVILIVIGTTAYNIFYPKPEYKIALIIPKTGPDSKSGRELLTAAKLAEKYVCNEQKPEICSEGQKFFKLVVFDDKGDEATAIQFANEIADDPEFVAVIGHFSSSITNKALDIYCEKQNLTVIMPVPTATDITPTAKNKGCDSVLRIPPTNRKQAEVIGALLKSLYSRKGKTSSKFSNNPRYAVIFRDQSNPEYANNLGREILYEFSKEDSSHKIVMDLGISGQQGRIIVTDSLDVFNGKVDLIIVGMTESVLQTLRQAQQRNWRPRNIILTDGAVSENLNLRGEDVLGGNVYMLFQSYPHENGYTEFRLQMEQMGTPISDQSYAGYGYESVTLIASIMEDVLVREKSKPNRKNVSDYIQERVMGVKYKNDFSTLGYPSLQFSKNGDVQNREYHSYRYDVTKKRFSDIIVEKDEM